MRLNFKRFYLMVGVGLGTAAVLRAPEHDWGIVLAAAGFLASSLVLTMLEPAAKRSLPSPLWRSIQIHRLWRRRRKRTTAEASLGIPQGPIPLA